MSERPHHKQIILWASNEDARVYSFEGNTWILINNPSWNPSKRYKTILPTYQEAWEAYLDGELEHSDGEKWIRWKSEWPPSFSDTACYYRRYQEPTIKLGQVYEVIEGRQKGSRWIVSSPHGDDFQLICIKGIMLGERWVGANKNRKHIFGSSGIESFRLIDND